VNLLDELLLDLNVSDDGIVLREHVVVRVLVRVDTLLKSREVVSTCGALQFRKMSVRV
jgi:hypothetical protein